MQMKIIWGAAIFFGGWLWFYLFGRQLMFDLITAFPLIKKLQNASPDLIDIGARRYTVISVLVCIFISAIVLAIIFAFCPLYMIICFLIGAALAFVLLLSRIKPENRPMFDAFCATYYRFVPDDELRTAMFNKKPGQIKQRLYNMGLPRDFVPDFKAEN